jgi:hypothetical protein
VADEKFCVRIESFAQNAYFDMLINHRICEKSPSFLKGKRLGQIFGTTPMQLPISLP